MAGRASGGLNTAADGRTDAIYGEMHFRLPASTQVYPARPALNVITGTGGTPIGIEVFVGMRYAGGEGLVGSRGDALLSTYQTDGTLIGTPLEENDAEYTLYTSATAISAAHPTNARPAPSAVYELLRFGRVIGPDLLTPADVPHWRLINHPGGAGWVNLNAPDITKFSDADFPHWKHWHLVDDSADQDSRCDSATVKGWLDTNGDGNVLPAEATARMAQAEIAKKLSRAICKFPTEWNADTLDTRLGWLTTSTLENPEPVSAESFERLRLHVAALAFWPGGMALTDSHWHWQPKAFIGHFRKCGWLSEQELKAIYPQTPQAIREQYRDALNTVTRKYFYSTSPLRLSHFLGQGAVESIRLTTMQEASMSGDLVGNNFYGKKFNDASRVLESTIGHWYGSIANEDDAWFRSNKYNSKKKLIASSYNWRNGNLGDPDAQKYRGRGFKQLTGLINYARYWVYRGWLDNSTFNDEWWMDTSYRSHNAARMTLVPPVVPNPHRATATPFDCMDTGGWYLGAERPNTIRRIDEDNLNIASNPTEKAREAHLITQVTRAINGGEIGLTARISATREAKEIIL